MANGLRLRKIDEHSRPDHFRLSGDDECFFVYEYTSRQNYSFSATNSLISNLKKKPGSRAYIATNPMRLGGARELFAMASVLNGSMVPPWCQFRRPRQEGIRLMMTG